MRGSSWTVGRRPRRGEADRTPATAYAAALRLEAEHKSLPAQYFFTRAAQGGCVPAMVRVAGLYFTGQYVKESERCWSTPIRDLEKGAAWLFRAAEAGSAAAHYLLARCCLDGIGVAPDLTAALGHLKQVPFPREAPNPYEPMEALVFGSVSQVLGDHVRRLQRAAPT